LVVLDGVSLSVSRGEWISLMGPRGCGKTTLLQLMGLLDTPNSGHVLLFGDDAGSRSAGWRAQARLRQIGFVFQNHNLLGHLTARENVALPMWRLGGSRQKAFAAADDMLGRFGLSARAHTLARRLSMGEAQRVAIARSIANRPALVLADEPTGSLDTASAELVLSALSAIVSTGAALVLATHDHGVAQRGARLVKMCDGKLGAPALTRSAP